MMNEELRPGNLYAYRRVTCINTSSPVVSDIVDELFQTLGNPGTIVSRRDIEKYGDDWCLSLEYIALQDRRFLI